MLGTDSGYQTEECPECLQKLRCCSVSNRLGRAVYDGHTSKTRCLPSGCLTLGDTFPYGSEWDWRYEATRIDSVPLRLPWTRIHVALEDEISKRNYRKPSRKRSVKFFSSSEQSPIMFSTTHLNSEAEDESYTKKS